MTPPRPRPALEASFERLAAAVPATIGLAIAAPGRPQVYSLGQWSSGVAWSTIKVPLAIAAWGSDRSRAHDLVIKAITESDNAASEELWSQLGEPGNAARQVQAVLNAGGDSRTVVESRRRRAGFTAFGQTQWALAGQAQFAASLPGIPNAAGVVELMRRLVPEQRWGLAAKDIPAKGGWGPGVADDYLVRQFGILPAEFGHLGVALAADARMLHTGIDVINQITEWIFGNLPELSQV